MRAAVVGLLLSMAAGCATVTPHQYLDEETAATITVVASPWIFAINEPRSVSPGGFLSLYAVDVNRAGSHQPYLAVMQSSSEVVLPDEKSSTPTLEVQAGDRKLVFQSTTQTPRQLGIARPLAEPLTLQSRWWYFVVSKEDIAAIVQLPSPRTMIIANDARFAYVEFHNGSKELSELSATLR